MYYKVFTTKFFLDADEFYGSPKELKASLEDKYGHPVAVKNNPMIPGHYICFVDIEKEVQC